MAETGNNFDFESENLSVLPGKWKCIGKANPNDLIKFCGDYDKILHNTWKYVNPSYLKALPFEQRRTLQLVLANNFSVSDNKGTIVDSKGNCLNNVKITDPVFVEKLRYGYQPTNKCLISVSLGVPWAHSDWDGEPPCWKLIAGIIELNEIDILIIEIDREMQRVGWSVDQGMSYLKNNFKKISRHQLQQEELDRFLNYLKQL